jgi:hypothetical protein
MSWDILTDKELVCRLSHHCVWCGEPLVKGDRARFLSGKMDGEFQSAHYHIECYEAGQNAPEAIEEFEEHEFKRGTTESKWN